MPFIVESMQAYFGFTCHYEIHLPISQVRLGKNGLEEVLDLGHLSEYEIEGLATLIPELKSSIEKGIKFANQS